MKVSKRFIIFSITVAMLFVTVGLTGCKDSSPLEQIEKRLGISLPSETAVQYFRPKKPMYARLELLEDPTTLLNSSSFQFLDKTNEKNPSSPDNSTDTLANTKSSFVHAEVVWEIKDDFTPQWDSPFLWYNGVVQDVNYRMIYFTEQRILLFVSISFTDQ